VVTSPEMSLSGRSERSWWPGGHFTLRDMALLGGSVLLQLGLGLLFGHAYDMPIFMATGYLVATGQNPYIAQNLSSVFRNSAFQGLTSIGYPPPWPLVLGGIYRLIGSVTPSLLGYNLAIKIPIIGANVVMAFLVAGALVKGGAEPAGVRKAWLFLLWNPFLLLSSAAWGQFDSVVALLALMALGLLQSKKIGLSALLLGLAISAKPIALPLLPLPWLYLRHTADPRTLRYYVILAVSLLVFCCGPFVIFGWDPSVILRNWNAQLVVGGGMSLLTFHELTNGTYVLYGLWQILGVVWVPAVAFATWSARRRVEGPRGLLAASAAVILVFFLTRAWLSEPNIILVLPLIVMLVSLGDLPSLGLTAIWVLPLVFGVFNTSLVQLLFPTMPETMARLLALADTFRTVRLVARILVVLLWQVAGWWIVVRCMRKPAGGGGLIATRLTSIQRTQA